MGSRPAVPSGFTGAATRFGGGGGVPVATLRRRTDRACGRSICTPTKNCAGHWSGGPTPGAARRCAGGAGPLRDGCGSVERRCLVGRSSAVTGPVGRAGGAGHWSGGRAPGMAGRRRLRLAGSGWMGLRWPMARRSAANGSGGSGASSPLRCRVLGWSTVESRVVWVRAPVRAKRTPQWQGGRRSGASSPIYPWQSVVGEDGCRDEFEALAVQRGTDASDRVRVHPDDAVDPDLAGAALGIPGAAADVLPEATLSGFLA